MDIELRTPSDYYRRWFAEGWTELQELFDTNRAYGHLCRLHPALSELIDQTGRRPLPDASDTPVPDALTRIVIGQMLSQAAASTIHERLKTCAEKEGLANLYRLNESQLRSCGLSGRKAKTIGIIANLTSQSEIDFEEWRSLPYLRLAAEVRKIWGLSDWSAAMLAIFHFQESDLFPLSDGSLQRAMTLFASNFGEELQVELASPFRTYLAITLWAALDSGLLSPR